MKYKINYQTSNLSFLKVHNQLKSLGVANNSFFLKLYNPKLEKIDPFSANLTIEEETAILTEIKMNPWYFFRECCRMPVAGNHEFGNPMELNLMSLTSIYLALNNIDSYLMGPRQTHRVSSIWTLLQWIFITDQSNTSMYIHDTSIGNSVQNIYFIYQMTRLLPKFMQPKIKSSYGPHRQYTAKNITLKNKFITQPKINTKDPIALDAYSRNMKYPIQIFNKFEFIKDNDKIYNSSLPIFISEVKEVNGNKNPYFRIITSPIGNDDTISRYFGEHLIANSMNWKPEYFDIDHTLLKSDFLMKNSCNNIVYVEYSYSQLGYDDSWFEMQCRNLNHDKKRIERELLLQR